VVFEDASREFIELVRERTDGDVEVTMYTRDEYSERRGGEDISRTELVRALAAGEIEMAHTYVAAMGSIHERLWALELPFLFRDYDHAEQVLQGSVARQLMDELVAKNIRGLTFAYSGGFRIVPSLERELRSLEDFAGLSVRTSGNPVPGALYESLGARAIAAPLEDISTLSAAGAIDAAEITYVRFESSGLNRLFKTVNQTSHSLFMTMMGVNETFFRTLPDKHKQALLDAGTEAGRIERAKALAEETLTKQRCAEQGIDIIEMEPGQRERFQAHALSIADRLAPRFGQDLVDGIRHS